jgi:hypothetical protein
LDPATVSALSIGTTNATTLTLGNVTNSTFVFKAKALSTAYQFQNASAKNLLAIDTSANQVLLGHAGASGVDGKLLFNNATNSNTVSIVSGATGTSYSLTLPTTGPSTSQCLQSDSATASQLKFASCSGATPTLQQVYDASANPVTITTTSATKAINIAAGIAPTADMVSISNTGQATTTAGVSNIQVNFVGGAAAVEASGVRVDYTPGGTSGGTWNGMRIVANAAGPVTGVTTNGLKLEGPSTPGAGTEIGIKLTTGFDIGIDVQSGGLQLAAQSDPTAPAANNLKIYAKDIAGRIMPKWIGPAGVDTPFQASLGFNRIAMTTPAGTGTTVPQVWGSTNTQVGTVSHPAIATGSVKNSTRRWTLTSAATAGSLVSHRQGALMAWRGNVAGQGGLFFTIRFNLTTLQAGNRAFVGLADVVTAPTNVDPTTSTTPGKVGMAINANTGNWSWVNNVTGTAPTVTALGASFPVNTTDLYELIIYSAPNGSGITYRVQNLNTAAVTANTTVSANIPANTTFLAPLYWMTNNATAAAVAMDSAGWYLESDN